MIQRDFSNDDAICGVSYSNEWGFEIHHIIRKARPKTEQS